MAPKAPPWSKDEDKRLTELHGQGLSLTKCAQKMGRHLDTIRKHAKRLNLDVDRSKVAAAAATTRNQNAVRRASIIAKLYTQAEGELDRLEAGTWDTLVKVKGSDVVQALPFVPPRDRRDTYDSVYKALASAKNMEAIDSGSDTAEAKGLLVDLAVRLGVAPAGTEDDSPTEPAE